MNSSITSLVIVPLLSSAAFVMLAPAIARRMPPRLATWALSVGAGALAVATVAFPMLVLATVVGQWQPVASMGHWSARFLHAGQPGGWLTSAGAVAVLATQAALVWWRARRQGRLLLSAWRCARSARVSLVIVPDSRPAVFALPGWPGRIVATPPLLKSLTPAQRRVILAHEQAHLDARHDLHRILVDLAAGLNPLLWRLRGAIHLASERWADEAAAVVTGDRRLVAQTIGRVVEASGANAGDSGATAVFVMGGTGSDTLRRVEALLRPPMLRRVTASLILAAAVSALVPMVAAVRAAASTNDLFQQAELAYHIPVAPARD